LEREIITIVKGVIEHDGRKIGAGTGYLRFFPLSFRITGKAKERFKERRQ